MLLTALVGSACVHPRFSATGVWIGKARIAIEAEGQKLMKSCVYRFDFKPNGTCTVMVKSVWAIDGAKTISEFRGTWEQRLNAITVKYNSLDEKNTTQRYATTPRNWNEVQHVFQYGERGSELIGSIHEVQVYLTRK